MDNNSYIIRQVDHSLVYNTGVIDSNYYFQPFDSTHYAYRQGTSSPDFTFAQWQATGFDTQTKSSFVTWAYPTRYDTLFMNQTDNVSMISIGTTEYLDLDSNIVCGSFTLQPYTSKILIKTSQTCLVGIDANNSYESIRVYPNPANENIFIKGIEHESNVQVYDATGRMISETKTGTNLLIDVSELNTGIYFVIVKTKDEKVLHSKFVRE